jgi:hypothetical protein
MDLYTPVVTGALLALFTAIQAWINKGRFDALDRRLDLNDRRMDAHEQNNERRFEQIVSEIATLRSDLLQVVLALQPKQQTG